MENHYLQFTLALSRINKAIQKLRLERMRDFDLKGAHTLCIYQLGQNPQGLTSTELAGCCDFDRGLASRTLKDLAKENIILKNGDEGKYGALYTLTPRGEEIYQNILVTITDVQKSVDQGIFEDELEVFYRVLHKLQKNFDKLTKGTEL